MSSYLVQQWPDMQGDGEGGDAIVGCNEWNIGDWERRKSWHEAWGWLSGNMEPGDSLIVLAPGVGHRSNDYEMLPPMPEWLP